MWRALLLAATLHASWAETLQPADASETDLDPLYRKMDLEDDMDADIAEVERELEEEREFEKELEAMGTEPVVEEIYKKGKIDVMNHVHTLPIEEEEQLNGGYIFDVDNNNRDPKQRCYVRNQQTNKAAMPDNIENSIVDAQGQLDNDGTNRAQWAKCLPPPMYTLLSIESFAEGDIYNGRYEKRMRNATDFYATLKWLHNEACSHIRIRLENEVMLAHIREEVNFRTKMGTGYRIKQALDPIIRKIVEQYHSMNAKVNPANAKTMSLIKEAIGPLKQALRVAKHSSMVTLENGEGRRRDACTKSAKELLDPLYNNVMKFDAAEVEKFMATRPGPLDDMMTGDAKNGLGNPVVGSDGLPDALKNYGRCGKPLFDFAGYVLYTLTVSQDKKGDVTFLTKDGFKKPGEIVAAAMNVPLRAILPPDAYEVETKTTSYQDDLFASGNLACGDRADGLWTLTSYDRDSNENKVTATQEEGYFCVWMLDDILVLPANQRAGFSNTEFIAESPQEMARVMNGDVENYKRYFPKPGEKYKYYHCHYSPRNSGAARVHSFQHQAERHYPGGIRQYCNCDWRRMGMIVSRCDCTLDAKANGGCRRAEMEMLNEHTQFDLWRKDGNKKVPARVALVHGDLAEGKIKSYTYDANTRRRTPDNQNIYQADTGRVRATTNGNGGNNVVCSVDNNGNADNANIRQFQRRNGNVRAKSTIDPASYNPSCKQRPGLHQEIFPGQYRSSNMGSLNNFKSLGSPSRTVITYSNKAERINYPSGISGGRSEYFAARWWGNLNIKNSGNYFFKLESDDGSKLYLDGEEKVNNDHYNHVRSQYTKQFLPAGTKSVKIEYFQYRSTQKMVFKLEDAFEKPLQGTGVSDPLQAPCGGTPLDTESAQAQRSFFVDLNNNGIMDYPACRRRTPVPACRRRHHCPNNNNGNQLCSPTDAGYGGKEFPLRDIYAPTGTASAHPAGGVNYEFVDENGQQCDILRLKKSCKPADAGKLTEGGLLNYLAKFCDVPAALYQVPVNSSGAVPQDFGAVTYPMPIHGYRGKYTNYRAMARAEFGKMKDGTYLFCQPGDKNCRGNKPLAVQGIFYGLEDEVVWSSKEEDNRLKSKFYPTAGGSTNGNVPSSISTKWTQAGTQESGKFNQDILTRYRRSSNPGTLYAQERVVMDDSRKEGVTCLNGKYVYARKMKDGSRPVVSTIREGLNRNGPVANSQWACRYVGVHCNANNCNNNGNTEIAGPFVEPKMRAKKVRPTLAPTPPPTPPPFVPPKTSEPKPTEAPSTRRRSGKKASRRRSNRRRSSRRRRKSAA